MRESGLHGPIDLNEVYGPIDLEKPIPAERLAGLRAKGYRQVDEHYPADTIGGVARFLDFHAFRWGFTGRPGQWMLGFIGSGPVRGELLAATTEEALLRLLEARLDYLAEVEKTMSVMRQTAGQSSRWGTILRRLEGLRHIPGREGE